jgi:1-acyl-sn-glycerol-3-phosphate acyltransferase
MEPGDRLVFKGDELAARADVIVSDGPEGVRILRGGLESIAQDGSELYREIGRLLAGEPGFPVIGRADRLRLTPDEARRYNERLKEQRAYTPYERRAQKRREWTYRAVVGLCRPVLKRVYPHSVVNADAIPSERGLLFLSNHVGESDVPILLSLLRRPVHFLAKVEMAEGRRGRFLNAIGHIFVDRDRPDSRASAQMTITRILANGGDVLVFPEGTINRTDEFLGLFHAGAFRSAQISGASIVPIVVLRDSERKRVIVSSERIHVSLGDDLDEARDRLRSIMLREMARDKPTMTAL